MENKNIILEKEIEAIINEEALNSHLELSFIGNNGLVKILGNSKDAIIYPETLEKLSALGLELRYIQTTVFDTLEITLKVKKQ